MLKPSSDTGGPDFEFDEGAGIVAQRFKGGEADDVCLGPCVCDSLGNDFGEIRSLVDLGLAWLVVRGLEVAVVWVIYDTVVRCILGVGDRKLACMAGYLKVVVFCHFLDSGSKGFCGLLREVLVGDRILARVAGHLRKLLGFVETKPCGWLDGGPRLLGT